MYNYLKEKFSLSENKIIELIEDNQDYEELFGDYERLRYDINNCGSDTELIELQHELLNELEEEIRKELNKYEKQILE